MRDIRVKCGSFTQKMRDFRVEGGMFREKTCDFPLKHRIFGKKKCAVLGRNGFVLRRKRVIFGGKVVFSGCK